jgi:hypothetical protein
MVQPEALQHGADTAAPFRCRHAAHAQAERDIVEHGHVRKQRIVLEDDAEVALAWRHVPHRPAADPHLARGRCDKARDDAQSRALSRTAGAEQRQELPVGQREADIVQHFGGTEGLADRIDLDAAHGEPTAPAPECRDGAQRPAWR